VGLPLSGPPPFPVPARPTSPFSPGTLRPAVPPPVAPSLPLSWPSRPLPPIPCSSLPPSWGGGVVFVCVSFVLFFAPLSLPSPFSLRGACLCFFFWFLLFYSFRLCFFFSCSVYYLFSLCLLFPFSLSLSGAFLCRFVFFFIF